jgi:predicted PhzF superfamily epimerase YddE/YHI9
MIRIPYFQVDAFAARAFSGNPAGVCLLERWLGDPVLQSIAAEHNLSETAFLVRQGGGFELRWFTPTVEVDLCGHATLASGHVIFAHVHRHLARVEFDTRSGRLSVEQRAGLLWLDFPSRRPERCPSPPGFADVLGESPAEVLRSRDLMAVFDDERTVRELRPDLPALQASGWASLIVTAPGTASDFVSRFFAPGFGIPEDPVTGSAHCTLVPYWSGRLAKRELHARQLSARGGELFCADRGDRVHIGGRASTYLRGTIELEVPPSPSQHGVILRPDRRPEARARPYAVGLCRKRRRPCGSGVSIRSTLTRPVWLHCGEKGCLLRPCSVERRRDTRSTPSSCGFRNNRHRSHTSRST